MPPISILASGMVTAVGLDAASSCAAIRCGIDNFSETGFLDKGGEAIIGARVALDRPWRGLSKLLHMIVPAIRECLQQAGSIGPSEIPLLLGVAEKERPGRMAGLDDQLLQDIQTELGVRFHARSGVIPRGRVAGAIALGAAGELINQEGVPMCLIAGVDSFLVTSTLAAYESQERLLTSRNSNGFIPGEAGAALLVAKSGAGRPQGSEAELLCLGIGSGHEKATINSDEPLRGEGMLQAIKAALSEAGQAIGELDFRITDANGEQYWFKEATLALDRVLRNRKELFDIWHPADCIGETGAAVGPCALGIALHAARKQYAFGRGPLCHFSADSHERFALVLTRKALN